MSATEGATFVAGVELASGRAKIGHRAAAAAAHRDLLDHWWTTGHGPQLWTAARNAAALLVAGHAREAALLLLCADASPATADVDTDIARHSGRSFLPWTQVIGADAAQSLIAEATGLSTSEVIDVARATLQDTATR